MKHFVVVMLLVCAGCSFRIAALTNLGSDEDMAVATDFALGMGGFGDLAVGDMATMPGAIDMTADPCAGAPALGSGNLAAQCVIGNPPTIDGDLSEWPLASFISLTKTTAAQANGTWDVAGIPNDTNSSARYFVRWALSYLYVAVSITDDVQNTPNPPGSQISDNDAIEIFVDGGHEQANSYDNNDWQLVYSADGNMTAARGTNVGIVTWPSAAHQAWSRTSPSWTMEAAIPWSILGGGTISPGKLVGIDLKLDDNDSGTMRERDLVLYYGNASGNGGCNAPNCRTDVYGTVQLQGR